MLSAAGSHAASLPPPTPAARAMAVALVALVAVVLAWASAARLDIVVSAPGRLVPASQVKPVQAPEAGIVREVLVREGERVVAAQLLVRLDATTSAADARAVSQELALRQLTVRANDSTLRDRTMALVTGDDAAQYSRVHAQFAARIRALEDAVAQEESALRRAESERVGALQLRDKLAVTLPIVRQNGEAFEQLHRAGFIGELMVNDKRRELLEREQDLKAQDAALQSLEAATEQARRRIRQLRSAFRSQLTGELVESVAAVQRLETEMTKHDFRAAQTELRAPFDGIVQQVTSITPGAIVASGAVLFTIVPEDEALVAEVALANADAGFVAPGQAAQIKLAAFPFQKYGMLTGRVLHLGADAADPQSTARSIGITAGQTPPLAYKATIALEGRGLRAVEGTDLRLAPGLALTAEIHQGRRTVMEYLLSPVLRITNDAARER